MNKLNLLSTIHPEELAQKGMEIYKEIKDDLEKENFGKYLAIEVESGKYFIGETQVEALEKAKKEFPEKIFYSVKIGFPAVFTHSAYQKPFFYESVF
jgi:hypothetical protein